MASRRSLFDKLLRVSMALEPFCLHGAALQNSAMVFIRIGACPAHEGLFRIANYRYLYGAVYVVPTLSGMGGGC